MMNLKFWKRKVELKKKRVRPTFSRNMGFAAGVPSILQAGWGTTTTTPNQIAQSQLRTLQARCNQQFLNNPYGKRFVSLVKTAVVGPSGFQFIAMNRNADGTLNEKNNDTLEKSWSQWGKDPTLGGQMSWFDLQSLFIQSVAIDGEFLARIYRGSSYGEFAFQIQPIEVWRLPIDLNMVRNGNSVRLGIEYDDRDVPVAYYIRQDSLSSTTENINGLSYSRIPADQIIHCFMRDQVGQTRGWPWMATALERMSMLDGYQEAAVVAARIGASKPFKLFTETGGEFIPTEELDPNFLIDGVSPGQVIELPNGWDFAAVDTSNPNSHYASFVQSTLQAIASALGVSYNSLASDLEGVSYSTIRVAVLEDRDKWKSIQNWMTECFLMPVFNEWLKVALLTGNVGNLNASMYSELDEVIFQGRRWQWVDPLKDAQAAKLQVELGTKSRSDIIREAGKDPVAVAEEIEKESSFLPPIAAEGMPQETQEIEESDE